MRTAPIVKHVGTDSFEYSAPNKVNLISLPHPIGCASHEFAIDDWGGGGGGGVLSVNSVVRKNGVD